MRVVCTAGHVDHGKSTLVRALTGMEPDRLAEEQQRGLTIDLGFAWTDLTDSLGDTHTVAFVDVPGHERFIANMLAGAGAVDLTMFVVAADEGWKPQSQEHIEILDLLGVERGIVVVTKADLVENADTAIAAVRTHLTGTVLADADVIPVSAATGAGLGRLTERLCTLLRDAPPPPDAGRPRLWVDRSFTIRGAGTVVTGTLAGGPLTRGGDVAAYTTGDWGRPMRVRGLQALKQSVESAPPGSRVAVNISGIDRQAIHRGDALGLASQWLPVQRLDAWVRTVRTWEIGQRGAWHAHMGAAERVARVRPIGATAIAGEGFVRIELDRPVAVSAGDRFVLREAGRRATMAGGLILDVDPPHSAVRGPAAAGRTGELATRRDALDSADRGRLLVLHIGERGADDLARAAAAVGLTTEAADAAARDHKLLPLGPSRAHPVAAARWAAAIQDALAAHHGAHPVDRAAPRDVAVRAAAEAGCPKELAGELVDTLVRLGRLAAEGPGVRLAQHAVRLDAAQAAARDRLLAALSAAPFAPPRLADAARTAGAGADLVRELEAAGAITRVAPDVAFTRVAVEEAVARLRAAYGAEGPLTAARAKEVLGTTRKYALPLLEELDRRGITRRRGDVRDVLS